MGFCDYRRDPVLGGRVLKRRLHVGKHRILEMLLGLFHGVPLVDLPATSIAHNGQRFNLCVSATSSIPGLRNLYTQNAASSARGLSRDIARRARNERGGTILVARRVTVAGPTRFCPCLERKTVTRGASPRTGFSRNGRQRTPPRTSPAGLPGS